MTGSLAGMVRTLRERALLSQEELAERSGLSVSTIRGVESGRIRKPRGASVRRIMDAIQPSGPDRRLLVDAAYHARVVGETDLELARSNISCNTVSGYYHDHFFVPVGRARYAVEVLRHLAETIVDQGHAPGGARS